MKIAHITDLQLGCRQYGLPEREEDYYRSFTDAVIAIRDSGCQTVLFTGDQFEMVKPPARAVRLMKDMVAVLKDRGLECLGIDGNHDASAGHWLNVCGIYNLNECPARTGMGGPYIGGVNYVKDNDFLARLQTYLQEHPALDVLCIHQGLTEICPFSPIPVREVSLLAKKAGVKYVACGHIHDRFYYVDDGLPYSCPGSIEMTDMNEKPEKWWSVIDTDTWKTDYRRIPVRPVATLSADNEDELKAVLSQIENGVYSFLMTKVNRAIIEGIERVQAACKAKNTVLRMMAYSPDQPRPTTGDTPSWERDKGMTDLRELVAKDFAPGTDQHALITQIIDAPERAEAVLTEYIKGKLEVQ